MTFDQCEQGLNIQRYSQTCWQTGYMTQLGGDLKVLCTYHQVEDVLNKEVLEP